MNLIYKAELQRIEKTQASELDRLDFLPSYLGIFCTRFESHVFNAMRELCRDYNGGVWEMYHLSNGAFYMVPTASESYNILCRGNYFEGTMSAEAAGITATLFALGRLAFEVEDSRSIGVLYHRLVHYVDTISEARDIFRAID